MQSSRYCLSPSTQVPYLHRGNPTENNVFLRRSRKSTVWLRMTEPTTIIQLAACETQQNTWQKSPCFANRIALRLITVCSWPTNGQWKCSCSILLSEFVPAKDSHKVSADLFLSFQVSFLSTRTQLTKLMNRLSTWTTLELQPTMLRTLHGTLWQSSSAFAKHDWNWKLTMPFWSQVSWVPGGTISPEGISLEARKIHKFLNKLRFPRSRKAIRRHLGIVNYYRKYFPRMAEKLNPLYKLLKIEVSNKFAWQLKETFDSVEKALIDDCEFALKLPIPGKQLVLRTDASFRSAGCALKIEDNPHQKIQSKRKPFAPVVFRSKIFIPVQLTMSIFPKALMTVNMASLEFAPISLQKTKPTTALTHSKSVARFCQTEASPPALSNAYDYVLKFNFKIHTSPIQSRLRLIFSPDWNSESRRR